MHVRLLIMLMLAIGTSRPMPIDHDESTTELTTLFTSSSELDATTPDDWPETTTASDDDRSLESPSQTIEIRLHPQLLHPDQLKSVPVTEEATTEASTTTTSASDDVKTARPHADFGDRFQPQHGVFASVLSGRFRLKDSIGAALRRAITGSPIAHKLQHLPGTRTRPGAAAQRPGVVAPAKDAEITARKINFGTGLSSNLPTAARFAFNRHQEPGKHRSPSGAGETPAGTRSEADHDWLYGAHHRDGKRPMDNFRIPSTERWLVFGARAERTTTAISTTTEMDEETSTTASTSTTSASTAARSTTDESETTTLTPTPALSGITPEMNYATPESVHANRELDYGTPEVNHATPETNYATPEVQYGRPEADFVNRASHREPSADERRGNHDAHDKSTGTTVSAVTESITQLSESEKSEQSTTENIPIPVTKAIGPVISITLAQGSENIKELTNPPLDGQPPVSQGLEASPVDDDEDYGDGRGTFMANLDDNETDPDAQKYLVEEKTPDGYIVGEFGVISRSRGSLRGVRYTAHGSINPQLIQDALRTFLSLK